MQKAGIDPEVLGLALEQNAARSGAMDLKLPMMIEGDYEPHFSLKHMFKDVQLGIHMANALDLEVPATTVTAGVMYGALNHGWADLDFSAIFKVYEPQLSGRNPALPAALPPRDPPRAESKPYRAEPIVLEPADHPPEAAAPASSEDDPDALAHPYNFVKRWFVSRPGQ